MRPGSGVQTGEKVEPAPAQDVDGLGAGDHAIGWKDRRPGAERFLELQRRVPQAFAKRRERPVRRQQRSAAPELRSPASARGVARHDLGLPPPALPASRRLRRLARPASGQGNAGVASPDSLGLPWCGRRGARWRPAQGTWGRRGPRSRARWRLLRRKSPARSNACSGPILLKNSTRWAEISG